VYYGIDVGRGAVKGVSVNEQVVIPSYLAPYRERDLVSQRADVLDQLVVSIDGKQFFVGELARREGGTREFAKDKVQHGNTLPLLLTTIALLCRDDYTAPRVVVGLPVADYKLQAKSFENDVLGYYRVQLPSFYGGYGPPPKKVKDRSNAWQQSAERYGRPWKEVRDAMRRKREKYQVLDNTWRELQNSKRKAR